MIKYIPRTIKNISKNEEGFTLLEIIMAVSILTVGLLAVASLQVTAMRGNSMSMEYSESTERVQDIVEKLFNKSFTDPDLEDSKPAGVPDSINGLNNATVATADHSIDGDVYDIFWNVADNRVWDGASWKTVNGVKTIRVIVKWTDRGRSREYSFDLLRNRI